MSKKIGKNMHMNVSYPSKENHRGSIGKDKKPVVSLTSAKYNDRPQHGVPDHEKTQTWWPKTKKTAVKK